MSTTFLNLTVKNNMMNREIKFRGWFQGINGQEYWTYGYLLEQTNGNWEIINGETSWTVDNVGQFTGLFDKNGKEIYEGDILLYHTKNSMSDMEVQFKDGMFVGVGLFNTHPLKVYFDAMDFESIEVTGNIYEK